MFEVILTSEHSAVCAQHLAIFVVRLKGGYFTHVL